jgi:hypothetical protein
LCILLTKEKWQFMKRTRATRSFTALIHFSPIATPIPIGPLGSESPTSPTLPRGYRGFTVNRELFSASIDPCMMDVIQDLHYFTMECIPKAKFRKNIPRIQRGDFASETADISSINSKNTIFQRDHKTT